ncbi:MAG: HAD family phosphatase [Synechococcaceae cyanobacterium]|nr:HAD family phosphatase [Synechococcaceae cyanobacterium]
MSRPAGCIFDLDGLLLDTEPLHARAWREAAARFGIELSPAQLRRLRGRRRPDCAREVRSWIVAGGGPPVTPAELLAVRQPLAERLLAQAPAMPGAAALVRRCHDLAIPMALATSSALRAVVQKAAPHPWMELIKVRVHGDDPDLAAGKPSPDPFLLAARRLGLAPGGCWAFEDSPAGARSALAAGCRVHVLVAEDLEPADFPAGVVLIASLREVAL